jgi:hypothetical protein
MSTYQTENRLERTDPLVAVGTIRAIQKLGGKSLGGIAAAFLIEGTAQRVDGTCANGGFTALRTLDREGIYGERIERLYTQVCRANAVLAVAILKAREKGVISSQDLHDTIDNGQPIDPLRCYNDLREKFGNDIFDPRGFLHSGVEF